MYKFLIHSINCIFKKRIKWQWFIYTEWNWFLCIDGVFLKEFGVVKRKHAPKIHEICVDDFCNGGGTNIWYHMTKKLNFKMFCLLYFIQRSFFGIGSAFYRIQHMTHMDHNRILSNMIQRISHVNDPVTFSSYYSAPFSI